MGTPKRPGTPAPLTADQRRELAEHLAEKLTAEESGRVLEAVAFWFEYGWEESDLLANLEWNAEDLRARAKRIAKLAHALRAELAEAPPVFPLGAEASLEQLAGCAEAIASPPPKPRGQPRIQWRDDLFALVRDHYPPAKLSVSWSGHFEGTLALILGFLGVELEDLHSTVIRTLRRDAPPPFVLE